MHTLTPSPSHPFANSTSAKDVIRHERTMSEELADAEAQVASAENERWLISQAQGIRRRTDDPDERRRMKAALIAHACGEMQGAPLYTPQEVEEWLRRPAELGCAEPSIGKTLLVKLARIEAVPNARLRARYLELKAAAAAAHPEDDVPSANALAQRAGVDRSTRLERMLGVTPTSSGELENPPTLRLFLPYEDAVRITDALGMTYHEAGL